MKLMLDHTQRLNLHALLGAQRTDVGSIRAIWAVQDKLALDAEEEKVIELKRELVDGQERTVCGTACSQSQRRSSNLRSPSSLGSRSPSRRGATMVPMPIGVGWRLY
jgi:hypothetical protein